ncbi:unknown protein [Desulfotalea psychrophila LSv54]|uniref:Uncharacterized protein n=1 Tax=Desulfotalea psychrophila (strain LSv54 / DSM 12343) TaxID=177439 RepID=Q6AIV1_DESPS|nr:unknown protein [Desulfotalea psychrophila LSv54]
MLLKDGGVAGSLQRVCAYSVGQAVAFGGMVSGSVGICRWDFYKSPSSPGLDTSHWPVFVNSLAYQWILGLFFALFGCPLLFKGHCRYLLAFFALFSFAHFSSS